MSEGPENLIAQLLDESPGDPQRWVDVLKEAHGPPAFDEPAEWLEKLAEVALGAAERGANAPIVDVVLAEQAIRAGDVEEGIELCQIALDEDPGLAAAWALRAIAARELDDTETVEACLCRAVRAEPKQPTYWSALIAHYRACGRDDVADQAERQAHRMLGTGSADAPEGASQQHEGNVVDAALKRAQEAIDAGNQRAARAELNALLLQDAGPRLALLRAELALAGQRPTSPKTFHAVVDIARTEPTNWQAKLLLGRLYLEPGARFHLALGVAYCEQAHSMSGGAPRCGRFLADAYRRSGRPALADRIA